MDYISQFTVLLMSIFVCSATTIDGCWPGLYYSHAKGECLPCSGCRDNEVIRRQCHKDQDTLCGVFTQFQFFHPYHGVKSDSPQDVAKTTMPPTTSSEIFGNDDKWFTVTIVMVGILVFTFVVSIIVVLVTCVFCRRKEREIVCEPGYTSSCALIGNDSPIVKTTLAERFKLVSERET
ncbi:hypothetical protein ACF0H5_016106 [Mactra antiquata]